MKEFKLYDWKLYSDNYLDKKLVDINDKKDLERIYKDCKGTIFEVRTDLFPEPHIGDIQYAKVILLALNPGVKYDKETHKIKELDWYKNNPEVTNILKDNLKGDIKEYYYLNDDINPNNLSPGHSWIMRRTLTKNKFFKEFQEGNEEISITKKRVYKKIACIQFFPYHSAKFNYIQGEYLKSQIHNFKLLDWAMNNNKIIVCLRSIEYWNTALLFIKSKNKLSTYSNLIELKKDKNDKGSILTYISKGNLKNEADFKRIIEKLKEP